MTARRHTQRKPGVMRRRAARQRKAAAPKDYGARLFRLATRKLVRSMARMNAAFWAAAKALECKEDYL